MPIVALLLALLSAACAPKLKVDAEVKAAPVQVNHKIMLDTEKLEAFYRSECAKEYSTPEEVDACTAVELGKFMDQFTFTQ